MYFYRQAHRCWGWNSVEELFSNLQIKNVLCNLMQEEEKEEESSLTLGDSFLGKKADVTVISQGVSVLGEGEKKLSLHGIPIWI